MLTLFKFRNESFCDQFKLLRWDRKKVLEDVDLIHEVLGNIMHRAYGIGSHFLVQSKDILVYNIYRIILI